MTKKEGLRQKITPEKLHEWYLEATKKLNPKSYNKEAQKPFSELTGEQRFIDSFISDKLRAELDKTYEEIEKEKCCEECGTVAYGDGNCHCGKNKWVFLLREQTLKTLDSERGKKPKYSESDREANRRSMNKNVY